MLKVNDIVVYGTVGVCRFDGVSEMKMGRENKKYYVFTPVAQGGSAVYLPTENEALLQRARPVLNKEQIETLVNNLAKDKEIWCNSANERIRLYADALKSGSFEQVLLVARTLICHRQRLSKTGKKLHLTDERALRDAQRLLCDEVSYAMGCEVNRAEKYILTAITPDK